MNRKHGETSLLKKEDIEVLKHDSGEDTGTNELSREKLSFASPGTQKACLRVVEGPTKNRIIYLATVFVLNYGMGSLLTVSALKAPWRKR
jgi:hypothetical protein